MSEIEQARLREVVELLDSLPAGAQLVIQAAAESPLCGFWRRFTMCGDHYWLQEGTARAETSERLAEVFQRYGRLRF